MNSVLSFIETILSYGPALAIAIIPITIDSRHISASQESRKRAGEIISDTILARSPPSRSEDKACLMAGRCLRDLLLLLLLLPLLLLFSSSCCSLYYLLLFDSSATRPGSSEIHPLPAITISRRTDQGVATLGTTFAPRRLLSAPPLPSSARGGTKRRRRRRRCTGFSIPRLACIYALRHQRVTTKRKACCSRAVCRSTRGS